MASLKKKRRVVKRESPHDVYNRHLVRFLQGMRHDTRPATCSWLSQETYVLPPVVNIVYTMTFESERFKGPLDLVRFAQYMPNTKYKPPNFAAITIRLWPTTALLYMVGKMTLIRATTRAQALFFCHLNRQVIEKVPILLKKMDDPNGKPYVGTLEGYLDCSIGEVQNIVGSGVLPQDGVHLTRLLHEHDGAVDWDPGGFPNLIYRDNLPSDGTEFCANIAITGKIVLMGLKTVEGLYESYKMMCKILHDFDDPNAPSDPKERHKYRMRQLEMDPRFVKEEADGESGRQRWHDVENLGLEFGDVGAEPAAGDVDDGDQVVRMFTETFVDKEIGPRLRIKMEERRPMPEDAIIVDEEPLLFQAARSGQHGNVKFILTQSGSDMRDAVWIRNPMTGELLIREIMAPLFSPDHLQVSYLIEEYIQRGADGTGVKPEPLP